MFCSTFLVRSRVLQLTNACLSPPHTHTHTPQSSYRRVIYSVVICVSDCVSMCLYVLVCERERESLCFLCV